MALHAGRRAISTDRGRVALITARDGLAAQAGHDLTIDVGSWSGEITIGDDGVPTALSVTLDLNSLVVIRGTGGVKPLTDRDRREIAVTARKVLGVERHPQAMFVGSSFEKGSNGGGFIGGTLTLAGASRPVRLQVAQTGPDRYHAFASVRQTQFGIKPYVAFLGALRVSDAVDVEIDLDLGGAEEPGVRGV